MYGKTGVISARTGGTFVETGATSGKIVETFAGIGKTFGAISDPVPAPEKLRRTVVIYDKTGAICVKIIGISERIGKTGATTVEIFVTTWPVAEATRVKHS
jgi:hypothetical protein